MACLISFSFFLIQNFSAVLWCLAVLTPSPSSEGGWCWVCPDCRPIPATSLLQPFGRGELRLCLGLLLPFIIPFRLIDIQKDRQTEGKRTDTDREVYRQRYVYKTRRSYRQTVHQEIQTDQQTIQTDRSTKVQSNRSTKLQTESDVQTDRFTRLPTETFRDRSNRSTEVPYLTDKQGDKHI